MSAFSLTSFNAAILKITGLKDDQLYYALLGVLGATGTLGLFRSLGYSSDISKLPGPTQTSAFWGNVPELFDAENGIEFQDELMKAYGSVCRVKGLFGANELWISDPRALQEILIKGHDDFKEPSWYITWLKLIFGPGVSTVYGHQHKIQRKILNPVFTASHIRNLTPTMSTIAHNLVDIITSQVQVNGGSTEVIDIFKWVNLVALEIIGQAGLGHSFGVLEGKVPEYLGASRDMFPLMMEMWYLQPFLPIMSRVGPAFFRRFVVDRISHRPVKAMRNVVDIMNETAIGIMKRKREALDNGTLDSEVAYGQDIMTALLRQNRVVAPNDQISDEEILAQVNGLAFAGHDTTSSALSRTIGVLAEHPEIQDKLRAEIREAYRLHGKNLDYDQLNSLSYLDTVCRETLRLYAPATFVNRVATKDWTIPLQYPVLSKGGKETITRIHIPEGTDLRISLRAANRDRQTWGEDAEEFRPNRWLESLPKSVTDSRMPGIFSSTMTFLGGPRACPGMKFSQLEMKIVLSILVSSFRFEPSKDKLKWKNDAIAKPYVQNLDGTTSEEPAMPVKVTILGGSE